MRYILNDNGFIETISFNYMVECNNKLCTEYTGTVPTGYESLSEWNENANINAYKIVNGNLVFDSEEDARLQSLWASQQANNTKKVNVLNVESVSTTDTYSCDYINKMQKNAITVYRTDEQLVETTYEDVYFQSIGSQIGSKFTLENGQIRIGSGVTQVKVSGAVWVEVEDGYTWGHILKNGNSMSGIMFPSRMANQDVWRSLAFPPVIIDVQEGDIIKMGVTFSVANPNNRYAGFYAGSCYMTVEEL